MYSDAESALRYLVGVTIALFSGAVECSNQFLVLESVVLCKLCPRPNWQHWPGGMVRGILWAGGNSGMIGCLKYSLTKQALAQSWGQTVLTKFDARQRYSRAAVVITKSICSKAVWFRAQNSVDRRVAPPPPPPPPSNNLRSLTHAGNAEFDRYP